MPEMIEVEQYRTLAAQVIGRQVRQLSTPDPWFVKGGVAPHALAAALRGHVITAARRHGKLLLLDTEGPTLGIRFGMTGRLLVDGRAALSELEYGSAREEPTWDRFVLRFTGGGDLRVRDPRRLGGVSLDPDEALLGPDAASVSVSDLRRALQSSSAVKARLLDQAHLAGVGNLIADEALWRAGVDPARQSRTLSDGELRRLQRALRTTVATLSARGGSHTGDLQPARQLGGLCPKDGTPLQRRTIGGRTTFSCPRHQG